MNPARILILSSSHPSRNPRAAKEAATLGAAGYDVTVLTVLSSRRFHADDQRLLNGQPFRCEYVDLVGSDWMGRLNSLWSRGITKVARKMLQRFHLESAQALGPARALLRAARRHPADLTIAHTEIPLWAVRSLQQDGRRVAVDLEDWYSEDLMENDRLHRPLRLLREAEAHALQHASYCSTTSQSLASALQSRYGGIRPIILRNTFPLQPSSRPARPTGGCPRLVWFSQTIGPGRGLEWFLQAWAASAAPSRLTLIGDVRPEFRRFLFDLLPTDRQVQFELLPTVPVAELPHRLTQYDVGLALEPREPLNRDLTISNKIFQYLNAGLAVLATSTAGQREVFETTPGCGLLLPDDTGGLPAQLAQLLGDPDRLTRMQVTARAAAVQEFCWEKESPRLLEAVAAALKRPATIPG